jgi:hypothetical protein
MGHHIKDLCYVIKITLLWQQCSSTVTWRRKSGVALAPPWCPWTSAIMPQVLELLQLWHVCPWRFNYMPLRDMPLRNPPRRYTTAFRKMSSYKILVSFAAAFLLSLLQDSPVQLRRNMEVGCIPSPTYPIPISLFLLGEKAPCSLMSYWGCNTSAMTQEDAKESVSLMDNMVSSIQTWLSR